MEAEAHHTLPYLKEALIFLVSAGVVVPILQRFGLNPILGYLVAGLLVGPFGLVTITDDLFGTPLEAFVIADIEGVRQIAELGVVFLLFLIGLELSGPRLWAMRRLVFGVGGLQVVVTAAMLTAAGIAAGLPSTVAIAIGASLALSSTAIVVQLLVERGRLASAPGQVMFAVLLMQDIAVVPVILIIGSLASGGDEASLALSMATSILLAAVIVSAILFAGRRVIGPLFRFIGARRDRDMFTAAALLVIIGTATATQMVGLSMALGAFLAGLVFADTEFSHQLEAEVAPFKGLLLGLFFLSVGMSIDPSVVVEEPFLLAAVILGVAAIKAAVLFAILLLDRQPLSVAIEGALMLSQIGEFSLVGLAVAGTLGLVPPDIARVLVVAAGITMALTSALAPVVHRLASKADKTPDVAPAAATLSDASITEGHVLISGFGRIGQAIGAMLEARHVPYVALDLDANTVSRAHKAGMAVHYGDIRRTDVLDKAKARSARVIVLTMNDPAANATVMASLRRLGIDTPVVARARDKANASELYSLGADEVVLEAFEASLQMGEETLVVLGIPRDAAHAMIGEVRERERQELASARPERRHQAKPRTEAAEPAERPESP